MKDLILHLNMHGYGAYVFASYSIVIGTLLLHIYRIMRKSRYVRKIIAQRFKKS